MLFIISSCQSFSIYFHVLAISKPMYKESLNKKIMQMIKMGKEKGMNKLTNKQNIGVKHQKTSKTYIDNSIPKKKLKRVQEQKYLNQQASLCGMYKFHVQRFLMI